MRPALRHVWQARRRVGVVALAGIAGWIATHPVREADAFWHLNLGRAVWRSGTRIVPEPSAFTSYTEPCVVPEWLWGLITLALHSAGGWVLLSLLPAALAIATTLAVVRLARRVTGDDAHATTCLSLLGVAAMLGRMRLRPQALFMLLLPLALERCLQYRSAQGPARSRIGAQLVALTLVWAQVHGSFVLMPALLGAALLDRRGLGRREAFQDAVVSLLMLAACGTSAYGLNVAGYILTHSGGAAKSLILDMQPATWGSLNPLASPYSAALALAWGLSAVALARPRWELGTPTLWALLGGALLSSAVRFIPAATLLALPLAAAGLRRLPPVARRAAISAAAMTLVWVGVHTAHDRGPLGRLGLQPEAFPQRGYATLATVLPPGSNVLTVYPAGAPLGWWSDGSLRTYVDGRTPLYFSHEEALAAHRAFENAGALSGALRTHRAKAAIVRRGEKACALFERSAYQPVALDGAFTTFAAPRFGEGLGGVAPCGSEWVWPEHCDDPQGRAQTLTRLEALEGRTLARWIRAEVKWKCEGDPQAALQMALAPPTNPNEVAVEDVPSLLEPLRLLRAAAGRPGP